jgi:hypothetical protein
MNGFQEKLSTITVTGSAAAGLVEVDLNGKLELVAVRIAPEAMEGSDVEMLQDLIVAAFNDGMAKVKDEVSSQVGVMAGGLNIPGFPGMGIA